MGAYLISFSTYLCIHCIPGPVYCKKYYRQKNCEAGILTSHICDRFGILINEDGVSEGKLLILIEDLEE